MIRQAKYKRNSILIKIMSLSTSLLDAGELVVGQVAALSNPGSRVVITTSGSRVSVLFTTGFVLVERVLTSGVL